MGQISGEDARLKILSKILSGASTRDHVKCGVQEQDDAAVLRFPNQNDLVVASDFVRGTGFDLFQAGLLGYSDIGYYLIAANLSDLAAVGADALGLTTILRYPNRLSDEDFAAVFEGIRLATLDYDVPVVGGDIGSYSEFVLAATAFGSVPQGKCLRRKGARPGDLLCISGTVGVAISAQLYFLKVKGYGLQLSAEQEFELLKGWRRPVAHLAEGQVLLRSGSCTSAQDSSDGLRLTLMQLAEASGVGFLVHEDKMEVSEATLSLARNIGVSASEIAFSVSPDFALVFTLNADHIERTRERFAKIEKSFSVIGEVTQSRNVSLLTSNGTIVAMPGRAWNQLNYSYLDELASKKG